MFFKTCSLSFSLSFTLWATEKSYPICLGYVNHLTLLLLTNNLKIFLFICSLFASQVTELFWHMVGWTFPYLFYIQSLKRSKMILKYARHLHERDKNTTRHSGNIKRHDTSILWHNLWMKKKEVTLWGVLSGRSLEDQRHIQFFPRIWLLHTYLIGFVYHDSWQRIMHILHYPKENSVTVLRLSFR